MNPNETRILHSPSLSSDYAVVSMPKTAWYWLDDLARRDVKGFSSIMRGLKESACAESLSFHLRSKAQEECEKQMVALYNLANDNTPPQGYGDLKTNPALPASPDLSARMPSVYWLFHFMPHATYLTTVWERLNYHLKG